MQLNGPRLHSCSGRNDFQSKRAGGMAKNEDFETSIGTGGETHQQVPKKGPHSKKDTHLTTNQGIRVSDNQNSLRAGARGPTLLEDFVLREKIFHFDHERIPERIVHARAAPSRSSYITGEILPIIGGYLGG